MEDGCVIFNTMHLSLYGIVAKKNEPDNPGGGETGGGEIKDPNKENGGTGDNGGSNTGTKGEKSSSLFDCVGKCNDTDAFCGRKRKGSF